MIVLRIGVVAWCCCSLAVLLLLFLLLSLLASPSSANSCRDRFLFGVDDGVELLRVRLVSLSGWEVAGLCRRVRDNMDGVLFSRGSCGDVGGLENALLKASSSLESSIEVGEGGRELVLDTLITSSASLLLLWVSISIASSLLAMVRIVPQIQHQQNTKYTVV